MTKARDDVLAANEAYATDFGDKANLPMPPARRFAILTCMDAGRRHLQVRLVAEVCRVGFVRRQDVLAGLGHDVSPISSALLRPARHCQCKLA